MILDEVEKLLTDAKAIQSRYLTIVPEGIRQEHWIEAKHGPSAWEALAIKYPTTPGIDGVTTLGTVIAWLEGLIIRERASGQPVSLRLCKVRREPR